MRSFWSTAAVTAALIAALLLGGCKDNAPSGPVAGLGNATVSKYVAVGNSLTAGYQSNALFTSGQQYGFPNLIAGQLKLAGASLGTFEIPWVSDPGTPDPATGKAARLEILSMNGPVIGPAGVAPGAATNTALARPYDNLGVPGAVVYDFLDSTSFLAKAGPPRSNPLFWMILRDPKLGNSVFKQTVALKPDLVTFWYGNNDVLGFATSGGVNPSAPTDAGTFTLLYTQALGALRGALPNAKIVVANIPDVCVIPFFTTVGPRVAASLGGHSLYYQKHGNQGPSTVASLLTEANAPMITLAGQTYAALLGQPTGKYYRDFKYPALPPGIDTTKPFGLYPTNPWPDALTLDADEIATATTAIATFNQVIASQAAARGAALVDVNALLNNLKNKGMMVAGIEFTADYVSGGVFSLDGVHPSARGQGVIANEFIRVMNMSFGMSIPAVNIGSLPGIPAPLGRGTGALQVDPNIYWTMQQLFGGQER